LATSKTPATARTDPTDLAHLATALALARRGLGRVWPNPAVGCVLVREGRVVARGWTQPGGRPHAETEALTRAGASARGATAYVTLEPCAHHGKTPPCADALISAGIVRLVASIEDPDPRVSGKGFAKIAAAGIPVVSGLLADEAAEINAGFLMRVRAGRPLVTLKTATTLDGRIATHAGESKWITGETARRRAHLLRAGQDAVMVGVGTALADDPRLTVRLPGLEDRSPLRIVVDSRLRLPLTAALVTEARRFPTWLVTLTGNNADRVRAYRDSGVDVIETAGGVADGLDLPAVFQALGGRGLTRVLVEGGAILSAAVLRADLVDRIAWFRAPAVIGGDGVPVAQAFGVDALSQARRFKRHELAEIGEDVLETYARVPG
jgi:diaminohydroxyphosphoribosylaminopyrimidine deaminase/5-amino-6-(5-phosphoribosylamino)uracil reductase